MSDILSVNQRTYPAEDLRDPEAATITVVLIAGGVGDYAAYIGFGSPEWVRRYGNKLSFKEAQCHFATLEEHLYRD